MSRRTTDRAMDGPECVACGKTRHHHMMCPVRCGVWPGDERQSGVMMKTEELPTVGSAKRELITLDDGETCEAAGTTRYRWKGPGSFRRQTWPDGSREDFHAMDLQAAMLVGAEDDASDQL